MGWKLGNMSSKMLQSTQAYFQNYWIEQRLLCDSTETYFEETFEKMSHVVCNKTRYNIMDLISCDESI
jgi:hypothetical protein